MHGEGYVLRVQRRAALAARPRPSRRHWAIKSRLRSSATKAAGAALPPSAHVLRPGTNALAQLRDLLKDELQKVVNLFHEWDTDGDGKVSKREFHRALGMLGFIAPRATLDALFGVIDTDHSGAITYKELHYALRHVPDLPVVEIPEEAPPPPPPPPPPRAPWTTRRRNAHSSD